MNQPPAHIRIRARLSVFLLLAAAGCTPSCNLINPDEQLPVYLACDSVQFSVSNPLQGSSSAGISDMWTYVDGKLVGGYELPARFPVLSEGSHEVTVRPGIVVNGIKATRSAYPFYVSFDTTLNLVPGATVQLHPRSTYVATAQFKLLEDFEQTGLYLERDASSDTSLIVIAGSNAFEGHSGAIYLDLLHPYVNYHATQPFTVPTGTTVYAEINYRCDNDFTVGILSTIGTVTVPTEVLAVRASATWKKIYINLSDAIYSQPLSSGTRLYIASTLSPLLTGATIYLDNIKVVR
jgi:hypothetical protein